MSTLYYSRSRRTAQPPVLFGSITENDPESAAHITKLIGPPERVFPYYSWNIVAPVKPIHVQGATGEITIFPHDFAVLDDDGNAFPEPNPIDFLCLTVDQVHTLVKFFQTHDPFNGLLNIPKRDKMTHRIIIECDAPLFHKIANILDLSPFEIPTLFCDRQIRGKQVTTGIFALDMCGANWGDWFIRSGDTRPPGTIGYANEHYGEVRWGWFRYPFVTDLKLGGFDLCHLFDQVHQVPGDKAVEIYNLFGSYL